MHAEHPEPFLKDPAMHVKLHITSVQLDLLAIGRHAVQVVSRVSMHAVPYVPRVQFRTVHALHLFSFLQKLAGHLKLQPSVYVIPAMFKLHAAHRLGNGLDIVLRL